MSRTSRREMRELLERAGRRPVPPRVGTIDSDHPSVVDDESTLSLVEAPQPTVAAADTRTNGASRGGRGEIVALLEAAGSRPVPPADPAFLDRTEARILGTDVDELAPRRARRTRRPAVIASVAAAVAAFVVVGALAGLFDSGADDGTEIAVSSAVDTVVVLPNGDRVEAARGVELPDGTVIRTGPNGFARIDGVTLGPDSEAIVERGRLRVVSRAAPTTLASSSGQQAPDAGAPPVVAAPAPDAGAPPAPQQAPPAPSAEAPAPASPPSADPPPPPPPPPPLLPLPEPLVDLPLLDELLKLLPLL